MDPRDLKRLLDALVAADVGEFSLETSEYKLNLRRGALTAPPAAAAPAAAPAAGMSASAPASTAGTAASAPIQEVAPAPAPEPRGVPVKAPIVGTFYRSPGPESSAFVEVGDRVEPGKVLCIIEAMKLMNEIEAEVAGVVREVRVGNAEPVEYGQVLFLIEPA